MARLVDIELHNIGTALHGALQCRDGIFRANTTRAAVGDHLNVLATQVLATQRLERRMF
jgi:hypothetical protein